MNKSNCRCRINIDESLQVVKVKRNGLPDAYCIRDKTFGYWMSESDFDKDIWTTRTKKPATQVDGQSNPSGYHIRIIFESRNEARKHLKAFMAWREGNPCRVQRVQIEVLSTLPLFPGGTNIEDLCRSFSMNRPEMSTVLDELKPLGVSTYETALGTRAYVRSSAQRHVKQITDAYWNKVRGE